MTKITPTIIRSSASVAVFGNWTVLGVAVTGAGQAAEVTEPTVGRNELRVTRIRGGREPSLDRSESRGRCRRPGVRGAGAGGPWTEVHVYHVSSLRDCRGDSGVA